MRRLLLLLVSSSLFAEDAASLLAKARAAYEHNQEQEKYWNWVAVETRTLVNKTGEAVQSFPAVTAESVIQSSGRRCNAVVSWGDGRKPYMADADADARCQAMDIFRPPFSVAALLEGSNVSLIHYGKLTLRPDKARMKSKDNAVRCAASIGATVRLDPATSFPTTIEGEVTESGCDVEFSPVMQYGGRTGPAKSNFRRGATFRMDFALQHDRLGHPENSFWISTSQRYIQPWDSDNTSLYYWGRRVNVTAGSRAHRLVKEVRTTAKEFGAESQLRFDK